MLRDLSSTSVTSSASAIDTTSSSSNSSLFPVQDQLLALEQSHLALLEALYTLHDRLKTLHTAQIKQLAPVLSILQPFLAAYHFYKAHFIPDLEQTATGFASSPTIDRSFKDHEMRLFVLYKWIWLVTAKYGTKVSKVLTEDELLAHVIATECKLASGKWTGLETMLQKAGLWHLDALIDILQNNTTRRTATASTSSLDSSTSTQHQQHASMLSLHISCTSALRIVKRIKARLSEHAQQRALFMALSQRVSGLERPRTLSLESEQYWTPLRTVSIPDSASTRSSLQEESVSSNGGGGHGGDRNIIDKIPALAMEDDGQRVLFYGMVRIDSLWHRLMVLTPRSLFIARPKGLLPTITSIFSDKHSTATGLNRKSILFALSNTSPPLASSIQLKLAYSEFEVTEVLDIALLDMKRVNEERAEWIMLQQDRKVVFETTEELRRFMVAVQEEMSTAGALVRRSISINR